MINQIAYTAYLNGISALLCLLIAFYFAIRMIFLYFKLKKKLAPYVALLLLGMGFLYSGPTTSFLSLVFTGENIDGITYAHLSYWHTGLLIILAMYLGFQIFDPERLKIVLISFGVLAFIYYVGFFGFPSTNITIKTVHPGEIMDISFKGIVLVLFIVYILSCMLILGRNFLKLSKRLTEPLDVKKAKYLGWGWYIFGISGIIDTVITSEYIVIARVLMIIAYYLISEGFLPENEN